MSATPKLGNKMLRDVMKRIGSIVMLLVPVPIDDISDVIIRSNIPNDPFNRLFGFVRLVMA